MLVVVKNMKKIIPSIIYVNAGYYKYKSLLRTDKFTNIIKVKPTVKVIHGMLWTRAIIVPHIIHKYYIGKTILPLYNSQNR
jgi:hypothetical protein